MPQIQLPFFPHGATEINVNLAILREGDTVTYMYGHLPIFTHDVRDTRTFRMIISQLYLNGSARQSEICQTFSVKYGCHQYPGTDGSQHWSTQCSRTKLCRLCGCTKCRSTL